MKVWISDLLWSYIKKERRTKAKNNWFSKNENKNLKVNTWFSHTMLVVVMYCYTRLPNSIIKSQVYALYFIIWRRKGYLELQLMAN